MGILLPLIDKQQSGEYKPSGQLTAGEIMTDIMLPQQCHLFQMIAKWATSMQKNSVISTNYKKLLN